MNRNPLNGAISLNAFSEEKQERKKITGEMAYFCYIVECADGSFYTGWSLDPVRREKEHNRGIGAAYTKQHRPVRLVYIEEQPDLSAALKRERAIKTLNHTQKARLILKDKGE
jgi:putative endonuclease